MSVLIQINGETAGEAIRELSALASGISGQAAPAATPEAPKQERPARRQSTKPDPVKEKPVEDEKPETADTDTDVDDDADDEAIPTDVELRALAAEVGKKGTEGKAAVKKLLEKYKSANVTGVPDDKRVAFKRDLEALAAEGAE